MARPPPTLRPAVRRDAAELVVLADIAGHGLPSWLWRRAVERERTGSALEFARSRILRDTGAFSWTNAVVAEIDGETAGMLLGYRQPDDMPPPDLDGVDATLQPLALLEAEAPGTWYVNILAVYPELRGRGVAAALLAEADRLAASTSARGLSLIMQDDNAQARGVYERAGYRVTAKRPFDRFPGASPAKDWLLMVKRLV